MNAIRASFCCALMLVIVLSAMSDAQAHYGMCCFLYGLVSDRLTGKLVPDAEVGVLYARGDRTLMTFSTKTNFKGMYGFFLYARQLVTLLVWKDGYENTTASVYLKVGVWNVRLDIELMPASTAALAATEEALSTVFTDHYYLAADQALQGALRKYE